MKIRRIVGKLVPGIIGILAGLGWTYVSKMPIQLTAYPPESLTKHWYAISAYLAILFGLPSPTMLVAFRKRLSREITLLTVLNVITAWGLVTLFFISSDPSAHPELTRIGLGAIPWIFLLGGILWSIISFYLFGRAVDASREK